ncbi:MAG: hypothetical protein GY953_06775, partial [bacterium]|nr:hypothetical protein [bacterium]
LVSGNYFRALGVGAIHGRLLNPADDRIPGEHPVLVLSYRFWQRSFGGRAEVIGETLPVNGHPFTIVGVAPKGFTGAMPVPSPDMWVPLAMLDQVRPEGPAQLTNRKAGILMASGLRIPGLSEAEAQTRISVTASQLKDVDPERYADEGVLLVPSRGIIPMTPNMRST